MVVTFTSSVFGWPGVVPDAETVTVVSHSPLACSFTETVSMTVSLEPDSIVPLTCSTFEVKPLQSAA